VKNLWVFVFRNSLRPEPKPGPSNHSDVVWYRCTAPTSVKNHFQGWFQANASQTLQSIHQLLGQMQKDMVVGQYSQAVPQSSMEQVTKTHIGLFIRVPQWTILPSQQTNQNQKETSLLTETKAKTRTITKGKISQRHSGE
jgi:hypothetical protein